MLLFVLYKFAYGPVREAFKRKKQKRLKRIKRSEETQKKLTEIEKKEKECLNGSKKQAQEIVAKAEGMAAREQGRNHC